MQSQGRVLIHTEMAGRTPCIYPNAAMCTQSEAPIDKDSTTQNHAKVTGQFSSQSEAKGESSSHVGPRRPQVASHNVHIHVLEFEPLYGVRPVTCDHIHVLPSIE
jgi:hypothetical protein